MLDGITTPANIPSLLPGWKVLEILVNKVERGVNLRIVLLFCFVFEPFYFPKSSLASRLLDFNLSSTQRPTPIKPPSALPVVKLSYFLVYLVE